MLRSYSVIVPVLNEEHGIVRTVQSIRDSMDYFEANHLDAGKIQSEVIVVDDGSTDATAERVRDCARSDSRLRLLQHRQSFGVGPARNTGARASGADVLFYCDADDLFFPEHVFVGFSLLDHSASLAGSRCGRTHLRVAGRGHVVLPADNPVAAVRTGVYLKDTIHPSWKLVIQNTLAQNLCLRRECHVWIEGFAEELVYKILRGCEDSAFSECLAVFFRVGLIDLETVEHTRRPGNSFDRQIDRFRRPPGSEFDVANPDPLNGMRSRREDQKMAHLLDKWRVVGPPPLSRELLNWAGVTRELLRRKQPAAAARIAELATNQGVTLPQTLLKEVRGAFQEGHCP